MPEPLKHIRNPVRATANDGKFKPVAEDATEEKGDAGHGVENAINDGTVKPPRNLRDPIRQTDKGSVVYFVEVVFVLAYSFPTFAFFLQ